MTSNLNRSEILSSQGRRREKMEILLLTFKIKITRFVYRRKKKEEVCSEKKGAPFFHSFLIKDTNHKLSLCCAFKAGKSLNLLPAARIFVIDT